MSSHDQFQRGSRVRFVKADKRVNPHLRRRVGDVGTVQECYPDGTCRVQFDTSDVAYGRWVIPSSRLALVDEERRCPLPAKAYKADEPNQPAPPLEKAMETSRRDGWYWITRNDLAGGNAGWVPAQWRQDGRSWSSAEFHGLPDDAVTVGPLLVPPEVMRISAETFQFFLENKVLLTREQAEALTPEQRTELKAAYAQPSTEQLARKRRAAFRLIQCAGGEFPPTRPSGTAQGSNENGEPGDE